MPDLCDPVLRTEGLRNRVDKLVSKYNYLEDLYDVDREALSHCVTVVNKHSDRLNSDRLKFLVFAEELVDLRKRLDSLLEVNLQVLNHLNKKDPAPLRDQVKIVTGLLKQLTLEEQL